MHVFGVWEEGGEPGDNSADTVNMTEERFQRGNVVLPGAGI